MNFYDSSRYSRGSIRRYKSEPMINIWMRFPFSWFRLADGIHSHQHFIFCSHHLTTWPDVQMVSAKLCTLWWRRNESAKVSLKYELIGICCSTHLTPLNLRNYFILFDVADLRVCVCELVSDDDVLLCFWFSSAQPLLLCDSRLWRKTFIYFSFIN